MCVIFSSFLVHFVPNIPDDHMITIWIMLRMVNCLMKKYNLDTLWGVVLVGGDYCIYIEFGTKVTGVSHVCTSMDIRSEV